MLRLPTARACITMGTMIRHTFTHRCGALLCALALGSSTMAATAAAKPKKGQMQKLRQRPVWAPTGGRYASLDGAFTALANDASFFEANPAGSANMTHGELAFFHTTGFGSFHAETLSYVGQSGNWGYGASMRMFFPESGFDFSTTTEPVCTPASNPIKQRGAIGIINFARRIGGLSLGANLKAGFRDAQGLQHTSVSSDIGLQWVGNVAKSFTSEEPNLYIGLAATNLGLTVKVSDKIENCTSTCEKCGCCKERCCCNGKKACCKDCDCNCPCQDCNDKGTVHATDTMLRAGFAYRPFSWFLFSLGATTSMNVQTLASSDAKSLYQNLAYSIGAMFDPFSFLSLSSSFRINHKANMRVGVGAEARIARIKLNAGYRCDVSDISSESGCTGAKASHYLSLGGAILLGRN
ncbi:UPF0164 family protein [Treponema pallidum]|uniref:UPF0164 family protein n=1 Tax=Treponema pallidum TaxID=160 RepID=UPI0010CA43D7|nr:hypothetical protein TPACW83_0858 [Treponema pallidum subsp. pallidum]